jgi:hypothetical protein
MGYATFAGGQRPGILTAVAILDLVLSSLALPCALSQGIFALRSLGMPPLLRVVNTPPASPPAASPTAASGEYIAPRGLSAWQRQLVLDALVRARPISPARRQQLDAILADDGRDIIKLSSDYFTADRLDAYVTQARGIPDSSASEGDVFVLGSGNLTVDDHSAEFRDGEGSSIIVRDGSCTDFSGTHLGALQIAAVISQVQKLCNNSMTAPQISQLVAELRVPGQTLIVPDESADQVVSAIAGPDGSIQIVARDRSFHIGPLYPANTSAITPPSGGSRGFRRHRVLFGFDMLAGILLAASLLILGILLLRNWPASRQGHLIYAVVKIVLVSVGVPIWAGYYYGWVLGFIWWTIGVIYPVFLLIVMNLGGVRGFFAARTVGQVY